MFKLNPLAVCALTFGALCFCPAARGSIIFNVYDSGSDLRVEYSGSLDLGATSFRGGTGAIGSQMFPQAGTLIVGSGTADSYIVAPNGIVFGTGASKGAVPLSNAGDSFGFANMFPQSFTSLYVPLGYVSGTFISGGSLYQNNSLSNMRIPVGTYSLNFSNGVHSDSIVINAGVPEPASAWLMATGLALGLGIWRRRKH